MVVNLRFMGAFGALAFGLLATFFCSELFLRLCIYFKPALILGSTAEPEYFWESQFLQSYGNYTSSDPNNPRITATSFHPERGWTCTPNYNGTAAEKNVSIDPLGARRTEPPEISASNKGRPNVLILGDSFTWGCCENPDPDTWPWLLQEMQPKLKINNQAVSGYGFDQMYLALKELAPIYSPVACIVATIPNDLDRTLHRFRDYQKPRFYLKEGELVLTNTPVRPLEETYKNLLFKHASLEGTASAFSWRPLAPFVVREMTRKLYNQTLGNQHELVELNTAIAKEVPPVCSKYGGKTLFVSLTTEPQLPPGQKELNEVLQAQWREKFGVDGIAVRDTFIAKGIPITGNHYFRRENIEVANLVSEWIDKNINRNPNPGQN